MTAALFRTERVSLVDLIGTDPVAGSGAADPILRNQSDFGKYLTPEQTKFYLGTYGNPGTAARLYAENSIRGGYHNLTLSQVLARIGAKIDQNAATIAAKTGAPVAGAAAFKQLTEAKELGEINEVMASEWVAGMIADREGSETQQQADNRHNAIRHTSVAMGGHPNLSLTDAGAVVTAGLAMWATAWGVVLDDWLEYYKANPNAKPWELTGQGLAVTGSAGGWGGGLLKFAQGLDKFVKHPLKVLRRVFVTEVGKGLRAIARNILDAEANAPWLATFFTKPLGFHLQAVALNELGRAMIDGSISSFNEQAVGYATGETLTAAGQALIAASPFLPPPYNVLAAAVGALSVAAGGFITDTISQKERQRMLDAQAAEASRLATQQANERAAAEAAAQAAAAIQYEYAWGSYSNGVVLWTAFVWNPNAGQWQAAWAYIDGVGWQSLN